MLQSFAHSLPLLSLLLVLPLLIAQPQVIPLPSACSSSSPALHRQLSHFLSLLLCSFAPLPVSVRCMSKLVRVLLRALHSEEVVDRLASSPFMRQSAAAAHSVVQTAKDKSLNLAKRTLTAAHIPHSTLHTPTSAQIARSRTAFLPTALHTMSCAAPTALITALSRPAVGLTLYHPLLCYAVLCCAVLCCGHCLFCCRAELSEEGVTVDNVVRSVCTDRERHMAPPSAAIRYTPFRSVPFRSDSYQSYRRCCSLISSVHGRLCLSVCCACLVSRVQCR